MRTSQAVKDERSPTMNKVVAELELESTTENSAGHQTALLAGFLGWMLDAFDFFLVVFCLTAIARDFHQPDRAIALSITLPLAFRPLAPFIFSTLPNQYA